MGQRAGVTATRSERGGVLVEFALVSLVLYLLLAASITFGLMFHSAQVAQDVARLAARELALTPLPANMTFEDALLATSGTIFDPNQLVVDVDAVTTAGLTLDQYFATAPVVNRALRPVYIFEQLAGRRLLRFPGALLNSPNPTVFNAGLTVGVPLVEARAASGAETIRWVPVLEEVRLDPADPTTGPFSASSLSPDQGLVALRVNIPHQSAAMSSFDPPPGWPPTPNWHTANQADDSAVQVLPGSAPAYGTVIPSIAAPDNAPVYSGPYGLGTQEALGGTLRPYRRLLSGQALFRREVFL